MSTRDAPLRAHPKVVLSELPDGTGVLLHMETKFYFALNRTGLALWRALSERPATVGELGAALAGRFDVTPERAAADVASLLAELERERLVIRAGAEPA